MRSTKFVAVAAALSLVSTPVLAQTSADTTMAEPEDAAGNRTALFVVLALVAAVLVIVGIGGGDDDSVSA